MPSAPSPDILDSEILEIEKVYNFVNAKAQHSARLNRGEFDREIVDRFAAIGFRVEVAWWHTDQDDVKIPEIQITGRINQSPFGFDHERMQHEVRKDVLELGQGGIIKASPADVQAALAKERSHKH